MKYIRTFLLQSSHFNGQNEYDRLRRSRESAATGDYHTAYTEVLWASMGTHGHNFEVTVEVDVEGTDDNGYAVDDEKLAALVGEWDNQNLSLHPDFEAHGHRATTENMVDLLIEKIRKTFPELWRGRVRVRETRDIYAENTWQKLP